MKKTIISLLVAFVFSIGSTYAQKETFFSTKKNVEFVYEEGHMDLGAKGTATLKDNAGGILVLHVTYYWIHDYAKKQNPQKKQIVLRFGDQGNIYSFKDGDDRKTGTIRNNSLKLSGKRGDWIQISLPKEEPAQNMEDVRVRNVKPAVQPRPNPNAPKELMVQIQNVWKSSYLNIENGLACGEIAPGWHSARWILEECEGFYKIKNVWKGTYLHIEGGLAVQCSEIQPGWHSAMWTIEAIPGTDQVRIKNRWKGTYLNIEHGSLHCTDIQPGWDSAKWRIPHVK